jgi:hypothetical protein
VTYYIIYLDELRYTTINLRKVGTSVEIPNVDILDTKQEC